MASGSAVVADRTLAKQVVSHHRELLAIEMEAYGVFLAAEEAPEPRPIACVLKAVMDYADGDKTDRFKHYAAYVSAHGLAALIGRYFGRSGGL